MLPTGYLCGAVNGRTYRAHRLIWAIAHGSWPDKHIDHINGTKTDNRLLNLRVVTASQNLRNAKMPSTNASGAVGVTWYKAKSKWHASIYGDGGKVHLGYFEKFEDAVTARRIAEVEHGYHSNHGREESA